jgi:hypothetical protein
VPTIKHFTDTYAKIFPVFLQIPFYIKIAVLSILPLNDSFLATLP